MEEDFTTEFWWDTTNLSTDYATHGFHPYPAKFIPQIPQRAMRMFSEEGDRVLDPFCGCGTTLVEAKLMGRDAIGTDINPIATHISRTKSTPIAEETLSDVDILIESIERDVAALYMESLDDRSVIEYELPEFHNRDHWFQDHVQQELAVILAHLRNIENRDLRRFLTTCLSAIVVNVSNQESDTRYAAVEKDIDPRDTVELFEKKVQENLVGLRKLNQGAQASSIDVYDADARELTMLQDDSVDLVVTSPPYANTYDYYLYHKMRMFWLGMDYREAQEDEIGSRYKYSSQEEDPETFFENLRLSLAEMERVLVDSGRAVFIIGDSIIRGEFFEMDDKIREICEGLNLRVSAQITQDLSTYTSFNASFGSQDKQEYILFLKR